MSQMPKVSQISKCLFQRNAMDTSIIFILGILGTSYPIVFPVIFRLRPMNMPITTNH